MTELTEARNDLNKVARTLDRYSRSVNYAIAGQAIPSYLIRELSAAVQHLNRLESEALAVRGVEAPPVKTEPSFPGDQPGQWENLPSTGQIRRGDQLWSVTPSGLARTLEWVAVSDARVLYCSELAARQAVVRIGLTGHETSSDKSEEIRLRIAPITVFRPDVTATNY